MGQLLLVELLFSQTDPPFYGKNGGMHTEIMLDMLDKNQDKMVTFMIPHSDTCTLPETIMEVERFGWKTYFPLQVRPAQLP